MAKKHSQRTAEPTDQTETVQPTTAKDKPGGRLIGSWFADAAKQGGTDAEIAERINRMADDASKDYQATAEKVAEWKAKQSGEARTRQGRSRADPTGKSEPTLSDLLRVKELVGDDAEGYAKRASELVQVADAVGGLKVLYQCLEALAMLQK